MPTLAVAGLTIVALSAIIFVWIIAVPLFRTVRGLIAAFARGSGRS